MSIIYSENFDGVTAPALPAGMTYTGMQTYAPGSALAHSGANVLRVTANATSLTAYTTPDDGNGGDAECSAWVQIVARVQQNTPGLMVRVTATPDSTMYDLSANDLTNVLQVRKRIAGTFTTLGATVSWTPPQGVWMFWALRAVGSSISARIQRADTGQWLSSSGSWATGQQDVISRTDSSITGAGRAGLRLFRSQSTDVHWVDDFMFQSITSASPVPVLASSIYRRRRSS